MGNVKVARVSAVKVCLFQLMICVGGTLGAVAAHGSEALFKYQGKGVTKKDLPVGDQQKISELEAQFHTQLTQLVEEVALNHHLENLAKKLGKTRTDVENSLLAVTGPTDEEVKQWFDQNKDRIPPDYGFDKVKEEIRRYLSQEKSTKKRSELLAGLTKSGDIQLMLKEPDVIPVTIDTAGRPVLGDVKAPVTIVEFADYQCPHCQAAGKVLKETIKKYPGKVKFVFMDFPVNPSGVSKTVAQGAYCAHKQGKYWEYHELAFGKQKELNNQSPESLAKELSLKGEDFKACLGSAEAKAKVEKDLEEGQKLGITGTPTIYINGKKIQSYNESEIEKAIEKALLVKST